MSEFLETNRVSPIKFKVISEDQLHVSQTENQSPSKKPKNMAHQRESEAVKKKEAKNFSFEYAFPAVIFDKVCFSVDKSQQQSNFLREVLFRASNCLNFSAIKKEELKVEILKSINLSVPYGSIFGLLGPSSCGKTTLLRCLVGLLKPSSGSIRLFGHDSEAREDGYKLCCGRQSSRHAQRSRQCKVPGSNVGYMPQDLGLYEDFTISQLLTMFGQYMRMDSDLIAERIVFMAKFLDLPDVDRQISSLSGGQKRRVSFAIACIHMPPLIILDEPTVGVDPLLRKSIWKYLRRLASEENKTIIITTHYIEEAAQADQVALMRAGEILVQDTPARIMSLNGSKTLEEAFLKICNNVQADGTAIKNQQNKYKLYPQPRFNWRDDLQTKKVNSREGGQVDDDSLLRELKLRAERKLALFDELNCSRTSSDVCPQHNASLDHALNRLSMAPNLSGSKFAKSVDQLWSDRTKQPDKSSAPIKLIRRNKLVLNDYQSSTKNCDLENKLSDNLKLSIRTREKLVKMLTLLWALLYKNYRRNINSLPLVAFQFMLPMVQMISFSLCVGGRPTDIGLGLINLDRPFVGYDVTVSLPASNLTSSLTNGSLDYKSDNYEELLSLKYLSFIDESMISIKHYDNLRDALEDVRKAKLWAAMEIGSNFTTSIEKRFDLDNFYQLDSQTIQQSVIKLYPDRSNKILDMICHRSLVNSYRKFLLDHFEHFRKLPIEVKEPIFDIKPNAISNSIDGYTESIAPGLLASLTYIMAAGLTTFIMVVERSDGILERTFTCGINPVTYLLAHAVFRSLVMMVQIAVVLILTFYVLKQPIVGSIWLAYLMLMTLNVTGISYGLLISSIVTDQNGAALTVVSSLVVKITLSGILWPFEAIPRWLRTICYIQPLTMPVQALRGITLKGSGLNDRVVWLGFLVSISWMVLFLTISARRFRFYQHTIAPTHIETAR